MKIYRILTVLSFASLMVILSCAKEQTIVNAVPSETVITSENQGKKIVLGKKLDNPYSVRNMRKALANLNPTQTDFEKKYSGKTFKDTSEIRTTDIYVRFWLENDAQKELLIGDSLNLSNIPMDVQILQEGDYYTETDTIKTESKWVYTSVPVGYKFKEGIRFEKIENLFLPEPADVQGEEEDSETVSVAGKSKISKQFLFDLEDEALRLTGNHEDLEDEEIANHIVERRKRRPQGYVRVKNTVTGNMDPVVGVKIKTRRWFKWAKGWTNTKGFYSVNRRYRRSVRYTVVFKNTRGFKIWRSVVNISSARYRAGKRSNRGYDIKLHTNTRAWSWATVNNATVKYLDYCTQFGIGRPHSNLRIAALGGTGPSAAPMLRRVWGIYGFNSKSKVKTFLAKANGINIAFNMLAHMLKFIQPDLIIRAGSSRGTKRVFATTFHELAHASHFKKVGSKYWIKYINYIITYGTYGNGSGKNAGYCGVGEMWGNYFSAFCMNQAFPTSTGINFYLDENEDWYNPGFMKEVDEIHDITTREIFSCLISSTNNFSRLIYQLKLKTDYGKKVDVAYKNYNDWP